MPASIDVSQATQDKSKRLSEARLRISVGRYWLAAIFVLALVVRLWFAFADGHSSIVYSCDASEYLRDASGLATLIESKDSAQIFTDALKSLSDRAISEPQLRHGFEPVKELAIAGPIFPLFLLLSHATFGLPISQLHWQAPVLFQCLLSSLTCVLIAFIGKAAWNKKIGITAGTIAVFYPGFIVNSIRMYSESFSCFLLCAVVALTIPVIRKSGMFHSISTGILLAFLQLTRSAMVIVSALTFGLTAWLSTGRSRILRLAGLVAGLAIVFAPWLLFQQLAFNKCSIVVDRVGHYNLFIGTNISTQGYLSYPYPDGNDIEKKSFPALIGAQIKESPERFARLMLDKPLRLYKFPWNDFRTPIGPIGISAQVIFHQLTLALAAIGLILCLVDKTGGTGRRTQLRLTLASLWAMHCIYLVFITVPRYNLTSIPFLILFSAAGLGAVAQALRHSSADLSNPDQILSRTSAIRLSGALALAMLCARVDWTADLAPLGASMMVALVVAGLVKAITLMAFFLVLYKASAHFLQYSKLIKLLAITCAAITIPVCALPQKSNGRFGETVLAQSAFSSTSSSTSGQHTERSDQVNQIIAIPEAKRAILSSRDCYILIDCEDWQAVGNGAQINVNGIALTRPAMPIMPFAQTLSETKVRAQKPKSEQRYLECEEIYSSLTAAAGGGNLDIRQWFAIPIPRSVIDAVVSQEKPQLHIDVNRNSSVVSALYATFEDRNEGNIRIPSIARFSWEKAFYGVENESGFTDSRYDDKIAVEPVIRTSTTTNTTSRTTTPNIRLLVAPPGSLSARSMNAIATSSGRGTVSLTNQQIPASDNSTLWLATLEGTLSSNKATPENVPVLFSALFESVDDQGIHHRYRSPWVPTSVVSQVGTTKFQFAFPFQPAGLPGRLIRVSMEARSGGPGSKHDFFSVNNRSRGLPPAGALGDHHKIDSLKLELHNLPSNPIGYGHEVF